jgi:hypothetical protein
MTADEVVALLSPASGKPGDFPVLISAPAKQSVRLRPGEQHVLTVSCDPAAKWAHLTALTYHLDCTEGHVTVEENRDATGAQYTLRAGAEGDPDEYPVNCTFRVFARFAGHPQTRQVSVALVIKPDPEKEEPDLKNEPTFLRVVSRQPVKLWKDGDAHIRMEWNGKDGIAVGSPAAWTFSVTPSSPAGTNIHSGFSQPRGGRFSAVVGVPSTAITGDPYEFLIVAHGPDGRTLSTTCTGVVAERQVKPPKPPKPAPEEREPRVIGSTTPSGGARRPPYDPKVIKQEEWETGTCWEGTNWTGDDPGVYQEPTPTAPLTLILNEDYRPLHDYRKYLVEKKYAETEVESRLRKYKTHMYYHLYQMYKANELRTDSTVDESGVGKAPTAAELRAETQRVALTLIKIMEVSR